MGRGQRKKTYKKRTKQTGGFLGGLIVKAIIAKARKKKFNAKNYMKKWWGQRKAVGKKLLNQEVPTPSNTGMSQRSFWAQALGGVAI